MTLPDPARWAVLSPLLDELLDLGPHARTARLQEWQQRDPEMARELQDLLGAHVLAAASGLLEGTADPVPIDASIAAGADIGAYRLEGLLGEGGSGSVWRARRVDGRFEGKVAIKLLHPSRIDKASLARFRREGGILARLTHPNIARLFDAGVAAGGRPYLILEFVAGEHIDAYADKRRLTVRQRVALFRQVIQAVAHAHSHLVVHRDIKPSNILVDAHGVVKLLDFGIAKLLDAEGASPLERDATLDGARLLTPGYAAPEQLMGGELTTATDVYALGVVLYTLLAGSHPTMPGRSTPAEAIRSTIDADPVLLHAAASADDARAAERANVRSTSAPRLVQLLRGDLSNIVARCLRKNPAERYTTAAALGEDLRRYLEDEPVQARPDSLLYRSAKFIRKYRVAVAASVLATGLLIVATIVSTWQMFEAQRQREEAAASATKAEAARRLLTLMVGEIGAENGAMSPTKIIDRGMYLLDQQKTDTPTMVDQLAQMGSHYSRLNETAKELAALQRAEAIARRLGYDQGLAKVLCEQVDPELLLEHRDRAQSLLAEAGQIIATLARRDPTLEASCESSAAAVDDAAGHSNDAIAHAEHALTLLRADGRLGDPLYAAIASRLSKFHDDLGHAREAHEYTELALAAYDRAGAGGSIDMLTTLNNQAADLVNFGQLRQALEVSDGVMHRVAARGTSPAVGLGFGANHAAILSAVGRHAEALAELERIVADAAAINNPFWLQRAQYFRARALLRAGRHAEAREALDTVEQSYGKDPIANKRYLEYVTLTRAELLLRSGSTGAADALMSGLLQALHYPADKSPWVLRGALPVAAEIALALRDVSTAQSYATSAVELARGSAIDPARSADFGRAMVLLGKAQRAGGLETSGLQTIRQALPSLMGGLGPEHAEVQEARAMLATQPETVPR